MEFIYTWIPAYKEIISKLPAYRNKQVELIDVLKKIGVNVNEDEDQPDHKVPLSEIDPFTFLFFLGKHRNDYNKVKVLNNLCAEWQINVDVRDVCGIPSANAQKLWMFPWKYDRNKNEIGRLWDFFEKACTGTITNADFSDVLTIGGVGPQKITEALFITNPQKYLCLNGKVKPFVQTFGINTEFEYFTQLSTIYDRISSEIPLSFHEISFKGYIYSTYSKSIPRYYRIGTTAGEAGKSQLPDMIANSVINIGWEELDDLHLIDPLNKTTIQKALQEEGYYKNDNRTASQKAGEILVFVNELTPGDYILAAEGANIKAIGKIISDHYVYEPKLGFPHCRCVDWIKTNISDLSIDEGLRTTVKEFRNEGNIMNIKNYLFNNPEPATVFNPENTYSNMSLNQILYGPPGTGKTFQSINYAVAIVENKLPEELEKEDRKNIKQRFNDYIKSGQIILTTFHQSMGYEDFIEGIKPKVDEEDEDNPLFYEYKDGIFKKLCTEAAFSFVKQNATAETEKVLGFSEQYDRYIEILLEEIAKNGFVDVPTKNGGKIIVQAITKNKNIEFIHPNGKREYIVSKSRLSQVSQAFPDINSLTNIYEQIRNVIGGMNSTGYWAVLNAIRNQPAIPVISDQKERPKEYSYEDKKDAIQTLTNEDYKKLNFKKYVIIIDEINRGNVSQVFGELITLIEDDKRAGMDEALTAVLPYSEESFSVPPNLYVIGTMNTADRSVEALDTALRRRFSFIPILPNSDKLPVKITSDGINLPELLKSLNDRLTILKDKDHTLGHAWLWNVSNLQQLQTAFANKILPLLLEFFYNDYEKLGLVLGDSFFEPYLKVNQKVFAKFSGGNGLADQYDDRYQYKLKSHEVLSVTDFQSLYITRSIVTSDEQ